MKTRISNALIVGAILGVVVFGYTSDMYSRRAGLLVTSSLVAIGTLMATVALQVKPDLNMLWYFIVARGISGFGMGGEYPPSAAAGLEEAEAVRFQIFHQSPEGEDTALTELTYRATLNTAGPSTSLSRR